MRTLEHLHKIITGEPTTEGDVFGRIGRGEVKIKIDVSGGDGVFCVECCIRPASAINNRAQAFQSSQIGIDAFLNITGVCFGNGAIHRPQVGRL